MAEDLNALIDQLRLVDEALYQRRLNAQSDEERDALRAQSHAVSSRIEMLQGLLFAQASRGIADDLAAIESATAEVKEAIEQIDDLNAALGGIASLLGLVDTVIGVFA